jgi:iron complex transport system substrate-binding protein
VGRRTTELSSALGYSFIISLAIMKKVGKKTDWQEIVRRNPDVIIINDYGTLSAQEKIQMFVNNPALAEVEAIKKHRFVTFPFNDMNEGIRSGNAVQLLAKAFYPQLFQ